jgi:hypothetical protein
VTFKVGQPRPPNAGRKKGSSNKVTKAFKEAILSAFNEIGGEEKLAEWAKENQTEFYKICARLIPQEVSGPEGGSIPLSVSVKFVNANRG